MRKLLVIIGAIVLAVSGCSSSSDGDGDGKGDDDCTGGGSDTECSISCGESTTECVQSSAGYDCFCTKGPKSGTQFGIAKACDTVNDEAELDAFTATVKQNCGT